MTAEQRRDFQKRMDRAETKEDFRALDRELAALPLEDQDRWDLGEQLAMVALPHGVELD